MGCVRICNVLHGFKPMLVMVLVQFFNAGLNIIIKLIAINGMSLKIFTAYRLLFASAFMIPLALVLERNGRPKITWTVLGQAFLCGLFGISLAQNLFMESIAFASATYAVAITNLIPAITFILAICFRQEKLALTSIPGMAKLVGTAVGLGGAMLFILYKGITIKLWSLHTHLIKNVQSTSSSNAHHPTNYVLGSVLALVGCVCNSLWLIIQGKMTKTYPCPMSATALTSLMAAIQCVIFALCVERDWSRWKLGWNIRLLGVLYSGILMSGIAVALTAWCINMRGPLFAASFFPVLLVLVAIFASLLLQESLYLGSILGGVLIISGLYVFLWGKSVEMKKMNRVEPVLETPRPSEFQSVEIVTTSTSAPAITNGIGSNDNNIRRNSRIG